MGATHQDMLLEPKGNANHVKCMYYSADGKRLASGDTQGVIRVWDTSDGALIVERAKAHEQMTRIAYSSDNRHIASSGDRRVRIWRAEDLTQMREIEQPDDGRIIDFSPGAVDFSPDGSRLVAGCSCQIRIFDVETGMLVVGLEGHTDAVTAVTFSPNGEQLVSILGDCTIQIWDASTGSALLDPLEFNGHPITCAVCSPDGNRFVSGSGNGRVWLWDLQTGKLIAGPVRGHDERVVGVSFAPDGTRFVTGAIDGSMRVWDAHRLEVLLPELTGDEKDCFRLTGPFRGHLGSIDAVAYFPDGERIASVCGDGTVRIWDVRTGKEVADPLGGYRDQVYWIAISSDGSRLVGRGDANKVWDTRTWDVLLRPWPNVASVEYVRFSPDDQLLATSERRRLSLWDAETGMFLRKVDGHDATHAPSFSADGSRLATGGHDRSIYVWDVSTLELIAGPFRGHDNFVYSVAFAPDGLSIVSGSADNTVRVWDAETGARIVGPLKAHSDGVRSVSYSPDGTRICSTSDDKTICMWDAKTGDLLLGPLKGHRGKVVSVAFSPDGKRIVTGSWDCTIKFWDVETGEMIHFPDTHDDGSGSSVLDLPATHMPGQVPDTQPIQQIRLGSMLDLPATTRLQDFPGAVTAPIHGHSVANSTFFSFSRLRRVITNVFHSPRPASDAIELEQRHHRWVPRPVRTAYAELNVLVAVASRRRPREQAFRDVSEHGSASDGGGSARQTDVAGASTSQPADAATGEATQQDNHHGPPSMQPSTPYVASGPSEAPRITFAPGSTESDDSFEADCCPCCPSWCTCLHP